MTKYRLKEFLLIYPKVRKTVLQGKEIAVIEKYRRKKEIEIPEWAKAVEAGLKSIASAEDGLIAEIIEMSYFQGLKDREIIVKLPVSDSGFYRIKKGIEEKLYELLIDCGFVETEEILKNKI